ncbi:cardiolipin synthase [Curtobacterium sp. MCPF17_002]|uniref:cardiolipin synthase n=1 Tax=Curtobacterium sp. MCPF17_002 TaxID=2175645 RepID=UPI000DA719B3|nr:cardiolipin synthase [Curtobacterium sp. MCPF17_002]WIB79166.1 cardiolipin synthase [Curtobacterium sp. MCPF17_002]
MTGDELVATLGVALHVVVVLVAAVVVPRNRHPSSAIAWILAIVIVPALGILAFLVIGSGRLPRRRREQQREVNAAVSARVPGLDRVSHRAEWPSWLPSAVELSRNLGSLPMVGGNEVEVIDGYEESFAAMTSAVDAARASVHVEFYILVLDPSTEGFFDALARAVQRGVAVRVLSDHLGSVLAPRARPTRERLHAIGAEWHPMLPLRPWRGHWQRPDLRNHRKLVTIDGVVGFTGSQNLIDASYLKRRNQELGRRWREVMIRLDGPAVRELDAVFVTDWYGETDEFLPLDVSPVELSARPSTVDAQVVPSGPSFENDNNLKLFTFLLHHAEHRISITSPYFVPDESVMLALVTAASRGVDVELFVSAQSDQFLIHHAQRSYYEPLLRAGVRIWLHRAPTILHAKHFSVDDDVTVIGSSNLDIRSFTLNMEVSVLLHGRTLVDRMRIVEDGYRAASDELTLDAWSRRPVAVRMLDNLARLTSALQ